MDSTPSSTTPLSETAQRIVTLVLTVLAAVLYAVILGIAVVKSAMGQDVVFTDGAIKAARVLGGLVGSVVSAGFAGSWRFSSVQLSTQHPMGGRAVTAWSSLKPSSRFKSKLASLARALGFLSRRSVPVRTTPESSEEPTESESSTTATVMAVLYVGVYLLVGMAAFVLVLVKAEVPEVVDSSAWVWLGTVIASAYTYFGIDSQVSSS